MVSACSVSSWRCATKKGNSLSLQRVRETLISEGSRCILKASLVRNLHGDLCPFAIKDHKLQNKRGREGESRQYVGTMFRASCGLLQDLQEVHPGYQDQRCRDGGRV